jgi:hypothetical protein
MGAFDRWFEGCPYQDGTFYDNEAPGCKWPWPEGKACSTKTNASTVGAGYLTSELGNRTIAWLKQIKTNPATAHRPWFVYYATHAPHGPFTPAKWYDGSCPGVQSPRTPNFNYSGVYDEKPNCSRLPPGVNNYTLDSPSLWWWGAEHQEQVACQPPHDAKSVAAIDASARKRCQCLLSVDDTYAGIIRAVEEMGDLKSTYIFVTSDHGFNLGHHMMPTAKMVMYEHSLRIPQLFMGPGIKHGSKFDFLGTQVDLAPTWLGLAGLDTPEYMDGRSLVPLLVSEEIALAQSERLPASVAHHLQRTNALTIPVEVPMTMAGPAKHTAEHTAEHTGTRTKTKMRTMISQKERTLSRYATFHQVLQNVFIILRIPHTVSFVDSVPFATSFTMKGRTVYHARHGRSTTGQTPGWRCITRTSKTAPNTSMRSLIPTASRPGSPGRLCTRSST